jgi:hypothetical protein
MYEDDRLVRHFLNQMVIVVYLSSIDQLFERIYREYNIKANQQHSVNL